MYFVCDGDCIENDLLALSSHYLLKKHHSLNVTDLLFRTKGCDVSNCICKQSDDVTMPVNGIMRASYCRASIFNCQKFISLKIVVHIKVCVKSFVTQIIKLYNHLNI